MSEADQLGPTDEGTVLLDIGGDIGALVIMTGADLLGAEIEISPLDPGAEDVFQKNNPHVHGPDTHTHDGHGGPDPDGPLRTHVAVRERRSPSGSQYAALYPGLREGRYTVWGLDGGEADVVRITGGEVAQLDWR